MVAYRKTENNRKCQILAKKVDRSIAFIDSLKVKLCYILGFVLWRFEKIPRFKGMYESSYSTFSFVSKFQNQILFKLPNSRFRTLTLAVNFPLTLACWYNLVIVLRDKCHVHKYS